MYCRKEAYNVSSKLNAQESWKVQYLTYAW